MLLSGVFKFLLFVKKIAA